MKRDDEDVSVGIAFGVFLGVPVALFILYFGKENLAHIEWETLLVGTLATLGAAATVWMIRRQIAFEEMKLNQDKLAKLASARAELNFALAEICAHSKSSIKAIANNGQNTPYSGKHFDALGRVIEFGPAAVSNRLSVLIQLIQIADARSLADDRSLQNKALYITNYMSIYHISGSLFKFARNESDEPEPIDEIALVSSPVFFNIKNIQLIDIINENQGKWAKETVKILNGTEI